VENAGVEKVLARINGTGGGDVCVSSVKGIKILFTDDDVHYNDVCFVAPNKLKEDDHVSTAVVWGSIPCIVTSPTPPPSPSPTAGCLPGQVSVYVDNSQSSKPVFVENTGVEKVLAHISGRGGGDVCVSSADGITILYTDDNKHYNDVCLVAPNTFANGSHVSTAVAWGGNPCLVTCQPGEVIVYIDNSHATKPVLVENTGEEKVLAHFTAKGSGPVCVSSPKGISILSDDGQYYGVCHVAQNKLVTGDAVSTQVTWGNNPCKVIAPTTPPPPSPSCFDQCYLRPEQIKCPASHPVSSGRTSNYGCCVLWMGPCHTCCTKV